MQFGSLIAAQLIVEDWWIARNMHRLHSTTVDLTSHDFVEAWTTRNQRAPA